MSRAFTKERDDVPEPVFAAHAPGTLLRVSPAGRARLEDQLLAAADGGERKRLAALIADLVVVAPPTDRSVVAFGATVDVRGEAIGVRRFTVVADTEADVAAGRISETSPLGAALLGARAGDVVTWRRPVGEVALCVVAVAYTGDAGFSPAGDRPAEIG